jgi:hypothetical protein
MTKQTEKITIDGNHYNFGDLSAAAKDQLRNIQFVEAQLLQLRNELAISDTARLAYTRALKVELKNETGDNQIS